MRILMIAPEPFFQPRGTPFSVYHRVKALIALGHTVDLLTYHLGEQVEMAGLTVIRTPRVLGIRSIGIGFSLKKLPMWIVLFFMTWRQLRRRRYAYLHTHEDAVFIGALLAGWFRLPHLYDMHSSLPQQFDNYDVPVLRRFRHLFMPIEAFAVRHADAVIAICPALVRRITQIDPKKPVKLIENVSLTMDCVAIDDGDVESLCARLGLNGCKVVVYTGTLEANQGLDFLLEAFHDARQSVPELRLVLVGGEEHQVSSLKTLARTLDIVDSVLFMGRRPVAEMSLYMAAADILVSPRSIGNNTPLKIYSYMQSGKPILATDLETHRQVLGDAEALLVPFDRRAFAEGMVRLAGDEELGRRFGRAAADLLAREYSYERFLQLTDEIVKNVTAGGTGKGVNNG
ncbi:glycosyltransferase family 4 protein [bacterium]|nr:glycosyltransferase family 4 protein [candidate division CSSED10-310 bacterium]